MELKTRNSKLRTDGLELLLETIDETVKLQVEVAELLADAANGAVAACHAGWRGVAGRIVPAAIAANACFAAATSSVISPPRKASACRRPSSRLASVTVA